MKTGRLLDILSGHEGPVHGLMFSPTNVSSRTHPFTFQISDSKIVFYFMSIHARFFLHLFASIVFIFFSVLLCSQEINNKD